MFVKSTNFSYGTFPVIAQDPDTGNCVWSAENGAEFYISPDIGKSLILNTIMLTWHTNSSTATLFITGYKYNNRNTYTTTGYLDRYGGTPPHIMYYHNTEGWVIVMGLLTYLTGASYLKFTGGDMETPSGTLQYINMPSVNGYADATLTVAPIEGWFRTGTAEGEYLPVVGSQKTGKQYFGFRTYSCGNITFTEDINPEWYDSASNYNSDSYNTKLKTYTGSNGKKLWSFGIGINSYNNNEEIWIISNPDNGNDVWELSKVGYYSNTSIIGHYTIVPPSPEYYQCTLGFGSIYDLAYTTGFDFGPHSEEVSQYYDFADYSQWRVILSLVNGYPVWKANQPYIEDTYKYLWFSSDLNKFVISDVVGVTDITKGYWTSSSIIGNYTRNYEVPEYTLTFSSCVLRYENNPVWLARTALCL